MGFAAPRQPVSSVEGNAPGLAALPRVSPTRPYSRCDASIPRVARPPPAARQPPAATATAASSPGGWRIPLAGDCWRIFRCLATHPPATQDTHPAATAAGLPQAVTRPQFVPFGIPDPGVCVLLLWSCPRVLRSQGDPQPANPRFLAPSSGHDQQLVIFAVSAACKKMPLENNNGQFNLPVFIVI